MHLAGLFWEIPSFSAVASAERRAASSEHQAQKASREVRQLEARVEKLTMVAAAMWTLLKRQHPDLQDEQLADVVQEIDLTDGALDGRCGAPPWSARRAIAPSPRATIAASTAASTCSGEERSARWT